MKPFARIPTRPALALALATLFLTASAARAEEKPDCYVLAVGIDQYQALSRLSGCIYDARNTAAVLRGQEGKRFAKVEARVLLDREATRDQITAELQRLECLGKAGDFVVLLVSSHGSRRGGSWYFPPYDYDARRHAATAVTDRDLIAWADGQAGQGKTVWVILDACFSGQIRRSARDLLDRYRDPHKGGVVLMLSSSPGQLSSAMGRFSAFAQAVVEGLAGKADADGDGRVTLAEVRRYAFQRVYDLLRDQPRPPGLQPDEQDGACESSASVADSLCLAEVPRSSPAVPPALPAAESDLPRPDALTGVWRGDFRVGASKIPLVLSFDQKGAYVLRVPLPGRQTVTQGTYRLAQGAKARTLYLEYGNGADALRIEGEAKNEIKFWFQGRLYALRRDA